DPVATLRALAPGFQEGAVVVVIRCDLQLPWATPFDGELYTAFSLMRIPHAVIEAELYLLLHVTGEVIGRHPTRVDVESGFPAIEIGVDDLQLHGIPGRTVRRPYQAALAGRVDPY